MACFFVNKPLKLKLKGVILMKKENSKKFLYECLGVMTLSMGMVGCSSNQPLESTNETLLETDMNLSTLQPETEQENETSIENPSLDEETFVDYDETEEESVNDLTPSNEVREPWLVGDDIYSANETNIVGEDLPEGDYVVYPMEGEYYPMVAISDSKYKEEVSDFFSIDMSNVPYAFITLKKGDVVELAGTHLYSLGNHQPTLNKDENGYHDGTFRVGIDIKPGSYTVTGNNNGSKFLVYNYDLRVITEKELSSGEPYPLELKVNEIVLLDQASLR